MWSTEFVRGTAPGSIWYETATNEYASGVHRSDQSSLGLKNRCLGTCHLDPMEFESDERLRNPSTSLGAGVYPIEPE
jgi:hypothetical protein